MEGVFAWLAGLPPGYIYGAVILLLVLCGVGLPVTEELIYIFSGALAQRAVTWPPAMLIACMVGLVAGDLAMYSVGRYVVGPTVRTGARKTRRVWGVPAQRFRRAMAFVRMNASRAIFLGRFISGVRTAVILSAGALRLPRKRFMALDAAAGAIYVPIMFTVGYVFSEHFEDIHAFVRRHEAVGIGALIAFMVLVLWLSRKKRRVV